MTMTMGQQLAGAAAQTGGNLLTSIIGNLFQGRFQRKAQDHADQAATTQYNREIAAWNMQNEYNSPQAQKERLIEAGISPWTAYGQMNADAGSINVPKEETISPQQVIMPQMDMLSNYLQLRKLANEDKALQQSIANQTAVKEHQDLQNEVLKYFINEEMKPLLTFKQEEQNLTLQEKRVLIQGYNQRLDLVKQEIARAEKENERLAWEKNNLWGYEKDAYAERVHEMRANIANMWQKYWNLKDEQDLLRQQKVMNADEIMRGRNEITMQRQNIRLNEFEEFRNTWRKDRIYEKGFDPANMDTPFRLLNTVETRLKRLFGD